MQDSIMEALWSTSHISGGNAAYVEDLYDAYLHDPNAVPEQWREYFDQLPRVQGAVGADTPHSIIRQQFAQLAKDRVRGKATLGSSSAGAVSPEHEAKQIKVVQLINAYRSRGHKLAKTDPLDMEVKAEVADLDIHYHGLTTADLDTVFQTGDLMMGVNEAPLRDILSALQETYCGSIGSEITHINDAAERQWLLQRLESVRAKPNYSKEVQLRLLDRLTAAEGLERHLDSKYPGTKRFGLEGGESFVPLVDALIKRAGAFGAKEIVMGMAHRGRLNTLVNILGKNPTALFEEFEGKKLVSTSGDVKYHQGFSSNVMTQGGEVHLAMAFNPSHLEIVSPVVEGSVRARQDRRNDSTGDLVVPISVHGDAAFAGQGVVFETFQMSQTRAYKTGGTLHVVINNQVGFTTSLKEDARSTDYCTDIAKFVEAPVFHVNGDDPEAVIFVAQLAMDYRYEFKKDVVIDLVCYRRRGHNETDEPSSTQPLMYQKIRNQKTTRTLYSDRLVAANVLSQDDSDNLAKEYRAKLDNGESVADGLITEPDSSLFVDWSPYIGHDWTAEGNTGVEFKKLSEIANKVCDVPDGIQIQRQVSKIYEDRRKMAAGSAALNWGMAEILAYGTLLDEGYAIRMTGQDCGRGTFSHRHAVIHSQKDATRYTPLANLKEGQPAFDLYDSFLSEEAVLAFEYGYATTAPKSLIIWEAQFGDFANGAQVVIDQFITSGEHKWGRLCGLTMLLPHGYEGQGPEHSSARLERFMQLCAEHNIQVCIPTTPAQVFHMLRRQAIRPMRRPLIVMSPKWILRHPLATSTLEELANGSFQNVIADKEIDPAKAKRVVMCSGKVYYHLLEARNEKEIDDVALVRVEQLYPFPEQELFEALAPYQNIVDFTWCQEEPMNQGAWFSIQHRMHRVLDKLDHKAPLRFAGRDASAAPAAGYMSTHVEEQNRLVAKALTVE